MTMSVRMDDIVVARAPAKINLHLGVGPLRSDGYHDLATVFCALSLTDEVVAAESEGLSLTVVGEGADELPDDDPNNLAWRAAQALADRAGIAADVALSVRKSIPVAAGLAGGSADAAATLVACDALWQTGATRDDLLEIAAELGSDIAFSLTGGLALGTGRGELLSPVLASGRWHWVLAVARGGLSTAAVYGELDRQREGQDRVALETPDALLNALRSRDLDRIGAELHNDMEPAAITLMPELRRTRRAGLEEGAAAAVLCGSGPTMGFLVDGEQAAVDLAARLSGLDVCRTVRTARGPVSGARIIG